jgi:hypothetical protein
MVDAAGFAAAPTLSAGSFAFLSTFKPEATPEGVVNPAVLSLLYFTTIRQVPPIANADRTTAEMAPQFILLDAGRFQSQTGQLTA